MVIRSHRAPAFFILRHISTDCAYGTSSSFDPCISRNGGISRLTYITGDAFSKIGAASALISEIPNNCRISIGTGFHSTQAEMKS